MKRLFNTILIVILIIIVFLVGLLVFLTVTEYRPEAVEAATALSEDDAAGALQAGQTLDVLSWNIGYAGLGAGSDFFMDGGTHARAADKDTVQRYLGGIADTIRDLGCDLVLLQEVDTDSARTYRINEAAVLAEGDAVYAVNYACPFVPIPFPPMGRVNAGLLTVSGYDIGEAERISLPCPFSWPLSTANLKRCLLVSRLGIEGGGELVLVNLHLEAYDDGEGKLAQTRQLMVFLEAEYDKGNYVIAGGDFNQVFPGSLERYPNAHPELWIPGVLEEAALPECFRYVFDAETPTCRLLNQPYDPADTENTQYYVIDGFIVSPNVTVEAAETMDLGFADSDHNPVRLRVTLG